MTLITCSKLCLGFQEFYISGRSLFDYDANRCREENQCNSYRQVSTLHVHEKLV